jgi:DNA-binding NarL/FixJ family response regulator
MEKPTKIMADKPIKVVICDDHSLFRQGVKYALAGKDDVQIIGEAVDGADLLYKLRHLHPDVILLDINMPNMDGLATLPILKSKEEFKDIKVIILSMHNQMSMVSKMMSLGANSYLTKNDDTELIYKAIVACHNNEYFFNDLTNQALLKAVKNNPEIFEDVGEIKQNDNMETPKSKINKGWWQELQTKLIDNAVKGSFMGLVVAAILLVGYLIYLIYKTAGNALQFNNYTP